MENKTSVTCREMRLMLKLRKVCVYITGFEFQISQKELHEKMKDSGNKMLFDVELENFRMVIHKCTVPA